MYWSHTNERKELHKCENYIENNRCRMTPALDIMADCKGDNEGAYCKECWINMIEDYFRNIKYEG